MEMGGAKLLTLKLLDLSSGEISMAAGSTLGDYVPGLPPLTNQMNSFENHNKLQP